MARGITERDVHQAVDDLVAGGERPTVERVRARLGTGSPNTVIRHLDTWWSSLGSRLRQRAREDGRPNVPGAVDELFQRCWITALDAATEHALATVAGERANLESAKGAWEAQREADARDVAQHRAARAAAEQETATSAAAATAMGEQLRILSEQLEDLRRQRDAAHARNELLDQQLAAVRTELEHQQSQRASEREELQTHLRAIENRSLAEVDRARQALQQLENSKAIQARQHLKESAALIQARQQAEQTSAEALRELAVQAALSRAHAEQLERLNDFSEQLRAAIAASTTSSKTRTKSRRKVEKAAR